MSDPNIDLDHLQQTVARSIMMSVMGLLDACELAGLPPCMALEMIQGALEHAAIFVRKARGELKDGTQLYQ